MAKHVKVGLIGDRDNSNLAHRAIPLALKMAAEALAIEVGYKGAHGRSGFRKRATGKKLEENLA